MTVASPHCDGLRVVTPDGCTVADSGALQGFWTEAQYLELTNQSNRLLEFTDGCIEVLPMPTQRHQAISRFLFLALYFFVQGIGGKVFYALLRLRIREGKFREPDLLLVIDAGDPRCRNDYWLGADLVVAGTLTALVLSGGEYREHRVFRLGDLADSSSLPGFSVNVKDMFDTA